MKRIINKISNINKKRRLKKLNIYIDKKVAFNRESILYGNNFIGYKCNILNSEVGYGTYIGKGCSLNNTHIGKYCSIASDVKLIMGRHPTSKYVSIHPAFYSTKKQAGFTYVEEDTYEELKFLDKDKKIFASIGNDVWIGEGVKILEGVKIGDGAIIGAYSIVTKDLEPYSINVGTPAKKIKMRFSNDQILFLLNFKWWDKDKNWMMNNIDKFNDIEEFINENSKSV